MYYIKKKKKLHDSNKLIIINDFGNRRIEKWMNGFDSIEKV